MLLNLPSGAVAQLGERVVRNDEATGSIPVSSTIFSVTYSHPAVSFCPKLVQNNFQRWVPGLASTQFQHLKEGTKGAGLNKRLFTERELAIAQNLLNATQKQLVQGSQSTVRSFGVQGYWSTFTLGTS
jgi:hypothetical protein